MELNCHLLVRLGKHTVRRTHCNAKPHLSWLETSKNTKKKKSRKNKITIRTARGTRTGVQLDPGHHLRHDHKPKIQKKHKCYPASSFSVSFSPSSSRPFYTLGADTPLVSPCTSCTDPSPPRLRTIIPRSSPNLPSPQKGLNQQTEEEEKKANNKSDLESESGRPPIGSRASGPIFRQLLVASASCQC